MGNTNRLRSAERGITSSSGRRKKPGARQLPSLLHDNPCCSRPIWPSTMWFSSIHWSLQACLLLFMREERTVLHCVHQGSDFPALYPYPASRLVWSPLRASNEGLLRSRVARAQRPCQLSSPLPFQASSFLFNRMLKKPLFSPARPRRLLHPPALRLPRQPLCPGTRLFPSAFSHRSDPQRTKEILGGRKPWKGFSVRQDPVELTRLTSLQVPNQAISTEDYTYFVAFQDRWRIAIAP